MNATLRALAGRCALRMERRYAQSPEVVWRAVTEAGLLSQWYPFPVAELDLREKGVISFADGEGGLLNGEVTEVDPPQIFAFREERDLIDIELQPEDGGCLLVFTHIFDDPESASSVAAGWHGCLDALELVAEGRPAEVRIDRAALRDEYERLFAAGN